MTLPQNSRPTDAERNAREAQALAALEKSNATVDSMRRVLFLLGGVTIVASIALGIWFFFLK